MSNNATITRPELKSNSKSEESISINNAEYILRVLEAEGITHFFMVPGKLINPIMSRYHKSRSNTYHIKPIVASHEAGAAAMADGYARATGHIGVCMAIDGPGSANAIPMLTAAEADGSSVLLIAGQIPNDFQNVGAIQDSTPSGLSTVDMLKPICQSSVRVTHASTLARYLQSTLRKMVGVSLGTGYLSIAKEVLLQDAAEKPVRATKSYGRPKVLDYDRTQHFIQHHLKNNQKIAIIVGSRCKTESFYYTLRQFSQKYNIPVSTTISGKGMFDEEHANFLGIFGYSGHTRASETLLSFEADLILLLGFDSTQWTTLAWHEGFMEHKKIIQVDKDASVLGKYLNIAEGINGDEETFLKFLDEQGEDILLSNLKLRESWLKEIRKRPLYDQDLSHVLKDTCAHPACIVKGAREVFPKNSIAVADAGVHRAYATHYWKTYHYDQFFAATTFAPMGWAVPASIGIKIAKTGQPVVVFTGDGCMLMSGLEIQVAAKLNLDITFIVFNNGYYGASYFNNIENEPYLTQIPVHNWAMIAEGLGVTGFTVHQNKNLSEVFERARTIPGPKLIDVHCDHEAPAPSRLYTDTLKTRLYM